MGMLLHRRKATEVKNDKTTKLDDITPVEKKSKREKDDKSEK